MISSLSIEITQRSGSNNGGLCVGWMRIFVNRWWWVCCCGWWYFGWWCIVIWTRCRLRWRRWRCGWWGRNQWKPPRIVSIHVHGMKTSLKVKCECGVYKWIMNAWRKYSLLLSVLCWRKWNWQFYRGNEGIFRRVMVRV